jgi:hypothetical protein
MIEFKAECGHTVRARDEDAGGVVRCSYCGRNANVPVSGENTLDFLYAEVEKSADPGGKPRRRRRRHAHPQAAPRQHRPGEINPFAIVLRMCYAAALIIILWVVGSRFVVPMFDSDKRAKILSGTTPDGVAAAPEGARPAAAKPRGPGLIRETRLTGLYVASTPSGAQVFCVDETKAPSSGRIHRVAGAVGARTPGELQHLPDGSYVVEIAFPWNDPALSDPGLANYRSYMDFRRSIENASHEQRKQIAEDYFIPDEAAAVLIDQSDDQIFIVRQYRGVAVRSGQAKGVRGLFLPKLRGGERKGFLIEPLAAGYIPDVQQYEFDEKHVRGELTYYGVAEADQRAVLQVLGRIGLTPYVAPDGRVRLFKIDIHDGSFGTRIIREVS